MMAIYIFLLAFSLVCNIGALYYSWKILRIKLTSSFTWSLITFAFLVRVGMQIYGIQYARDVVIFLDQYDDAMIYIAQSIQMLGLLAFFIALGRIYHVSRRALEINQ